MLRGRPGRNSSYRPATRCWRKRCRHLPTVALAQPKRSAISVLLWPSADHSTTLARQTLTFMAKSGPTGRRRRRPIPRPRWHARAGKEAKLSYSGNLLVENRNGLIVNAMAWEATGTAERDTALAMLEQIAGTKRVTVGSDRGFDTADFISECRHLQVTPQVAQNDGRRGGSALDQRTTRHAGYRISQKKRKRIEECFGWLKTIALLRKVRHRGLFKVDWVFTFACAAYNLVRLRNLSIQAA